MREVTYQAYEKDPGLLDRIHGAKKLHALRDIKGSLVDEARNLVDRASREDREPTEAETQRVDELMAKAASFNPQIDDVMAKLEAESDRPALHERHRDKPASGPKFAEMFGGVQPSGFQQVEEFFQAMHNGLYRPEMQAAAQAGSESIGVDGGFIVPEEFVARVLDASLEMEIVRPRARIEPMVSSSKRVAGIDTSDHTSNIGGFKGQWTEEGGSFNIDIAKFRQILLKAMKLGLFTFASNELVEDGRSFEDQLERAMSEAAAWYLDLAFLQGSGAGEPLGVLNDPALITVQKENSQAADTIQYANLTKMFARIHPRSRRRAVWVINDTAIPQLLEAFANSNGSTDPVLRDDGRGGFTMLTLPVIFSEKVPQLGDKGDILLCDFSQYIVGMRKEMTIQKSMHAGFQTDETAYRGIIRGTGQGTWNGPMTPKNGSTQSWAVTLEERA